MGESVSEQANMPVPGRNVRLWVYGVLALTVVMAASGILLAAFVPGVARPWMGSGLAMALLLAAVVGISKTSSA
ncbi:MAG: hypothetical protein M3014_01200 [Chloroflexota bacterium]|nr:hypothetical protein [Chloroflexota bacterium]